MIVNKIYKNKEKKRQHIKNVKRKFYNFYNGLFTELFNYNPKLVIYLKESLKEIFYEYQYHEKRKKFFLSENIDENLKNKFKKIIIKSAQKTKLWINETEGVLWQSDIQKNKLKEYFNFNDKELSELQMIIAQHKIQKWRLENGMYWI